MYEQRINILSQNAKEATRREVENIFGGNKQDWARPAEPRHV